MKRSDLKVGKTVYHKGWTGRESFIVMDTEPWSKNYDRVKCPHCGCWSEPKTPYSPGGTQGVALAAQFLYMDDRWTPQVYMLNKLTTKKPPKPRRKRAVRTKP